MSKVLAQIAKAKTKAAILEIWIDDIADQNIQKLIKSTKKPLIIKTVKKTTALNDIKNKVAFIDIDLKTSPKLIRKIKTKCEKLIISFHDYKKTPGQKKLIDIIEREFKLGADIAKISTYAQKMEDNIKVLSLLVKFKEKHVIAVCMGKIGKISRIGGIILGNYITYASLNDEKKTADGQICIDEIKKITQWH